MGPPPSGRLAAAPATLVRSSSSSGVGSGWPGLHVGQYLLDPVAPPFLLRPSDGIDLMLVTKGSSMIGRFDAAKPTWSHALAGSTAVTVAGRPELMRWRTTAHEPVQVVSVSIDRSLLGELDPELTAAALRRFDRVSMRDDDLLRRIRVLEHVMLRAWARPRALAAVGGILQHLVDRDEPPRTESLVPEEWRPDPALRRAIAHVFEHVGDPLTVAELARVAHLSRFHFIRVFRQAIGITPHRFVSLVRLKRAGELLVGSDLPVSAVATSIGWSSRSQFSNAFLTAFGESPTGFRRRFGQPVSEAVFT